MMHINEFKEIIKFDACAGFQLISIRGNGMHYLNSLN